MTRTEAINLLLGIPDPDTLPAGVLDEPEREAWDESATAFACLGLLAERLAEWLDPSTARCCEALPGVAQQATRIAAKLRANRTPTNEGSQTDMLEAIHAELSGIVFEALDLFRADTWRYVYKPGLVAFIESLFEQARAE